MNIRYNRSDTALNTLSVILSYCVSCSFRSYIKNCYWIFIALWKYKKLVLTIKRFFEVFQEEVIIRDSKENQLEKSTFITNNSVQINSLLDVNHLDNSNINLDRLTINDVEILKNIYFRRCL